MSVESNEQDDLVRDALQVYVNEVDEADGGWLVAHYIAVIGLYRANADGTSETRALVTSPAAQADYIDQGLLQIGPELLAQSLFALEDEE